MRRTKEWWAALEKWERVWLVHAERWQHKYGGYGVGGYLPDDCSECSICGQAQLGSGACAYCLGEMGRIISKADEVMIRESDDVKKKWKRGYRVCKRQGNRYVSCCAGEGKYGWKIYAVGHITKRTQGYIRGIKSRIKKWGPLAVFDHEDAAIRFMDRYGLEDDDWVLFSCRYAESTDKDYWREGYRGRKFCNSYVSGKRFADEVELLEEVTV